MNRSRIMTLIQALSQQTKDGLISWEATTVEDTFQISFANYSVRISSRPTQAPDTFGMDYVLQIFNADGTTIAEVDDVELNPYWTPAYRVMKDLHDAARRQALGIDRALDELLNTLRLNAPLPPIEEAEEDVDPDELPF
jgi:hypothetical protein